jgi:hypothetical protein
MIAIIITPTISYIFLKEVKKAGKYPKGSEESSLKRALFSR